MNADQMVFFKSVESACISGKVFDFVGCLLKQSPSLLHVAPGCSQVADGETNDLLLFEYGSGDEHPSGVVHALHDGAVLLVDFLVAQLGCACVSSLAGSMAVRLTCMLASETEAHHAEGHGRD